jgi:hypothetical protein
MSEAKGVTGWGAVECHPTPIAYCIRKSTLPLQGRVICPSCQCVAPLSLAATGKSRAVSRPSRAHQEGRFAIVTNVGRGMRWTRQRRQTSDADPPSLKLRRDRYQDHRAAFVETGADGEAMWS